MTRSHPNNAVQKRQRRARLLHSIYTWHRWLGLSVLLWVLVFSISGLLIEASPALQLDRKHIRSALLLDRYGISQPTATSHWTAESLQLDIWDQGASIDGQWLNPSPENVVGITNKLGLIVIASTNQLTLFSLDGELVDTLPSPNGKVEKLGKQTDGSLVVQADGELYTADDELLNWQRNDSGDIQWSRQAPANSVQAPRPAPLHDISYERLLLDIHSGALFGPVGRWLSRLAAVVMILLAVSGFYTWFTRFARRPH
ncbi:MAG: PepSY-associated TM helix domain-containing protein [Gammaproteobacteria bacterium]|nr:PepSY-associated TM helix domain-containing protein [Gammaproteobacteria bacterium]